MEWIKRLFGIDVWEYGTCQIAGDVTGKRFRARRNKYKGNVQFILWKAGEQGHKTDYWYNMHFDHWQNFKPLNL